MNQRPAALTRDNARKTFFIAPQTMVGDTQYCLQYCILYFLNWMKLQKNTEILLLKHKLVYLYLGKSIMRWKDERNFK